MIASEARRVLIIGGGVTGVCAANKLAEHGVESWLVERKPYIGGHAAEFGCKAAEACLKCNVCVAHDIFRSALVNNKTHVLTESQLVALEATGNVNSKLNIVAGVADTGPASPRPATVVSGRRPNLTYQARLIQNPQYVNHELCTACGACLAVCPAKCIYQPYPGIYGGKPLVETSKCLRVKGKKCVKCANTCAFGAIHFEEKPRQIALSVEAVIVATGYQPFDPGVQSAYGYKAVPNVITGLEAERQLAATRKIVRPSDGQIPKRIAFIQCVGSRSEIVHRRPEDTNYCSVVCCAYAMRSARKIKYANPDSAITFFYMDLQNFGQNFTAFYREGMKDVKFIRARPSEVLPANSGNALIQYEDRDKNAVVAEEFDLVVLSVGMRPADDARVLADQFLLACDESGFYGIKQASGLSDPQKDNLFVIGACEAPRDIASCIGQAEAVCARILAMNNKILSAHTAPLAQRAVTIKHERRN